MYEPVTAERNFKIRFFYFNTELQRKSFTSGNMDSGVMLQTTLV